MEMSKENMRYRDATSLPSASGEDQFPLLRLPVDLVDHMCSIMEQGSLAKLSYASKSLHRISLPYIYEYIHIDPREMVEVLKVLLSRPDLGRYVRHLKIYPVSWIRQPTQEMLAPLLDNAKRLIPASEVEAYMPSESWNRPSYMYNSLTTLLLRFVPNLETLHISASRDFGFMGKRIELPHLKELQLRLMVGGDGNTLTARYWTLNNNQASWIQRVMPNLEIFGVNAVLMSAHHFPEFKALKSLDLNGDGLYLRQHKPTDVGIEGLVLDQGQIWLQNTYYLMRGCTRLQRITCTIEDLSLGLARHWDEAQIDEDDHDLEDENFMPRIMRILRLCRQTLCEIRLSLAPRYNTYRPAVIGSFVDFVKLEYLSLPASFISDYVDNTQPVPILDIFPKSLRNLVILKDYDIILPQLIALVKGRWAGCYPKLEKLTIQIPMSFPVGTALPSRVPDSVLAADPLFSKLEEGCHQHGVIHSVVPVWKDDGIVRTKRRTIQLV